MKLKLALLAFLAATFGFAAENVATNGGALYVNTLTDVKDSEFEKNRATYGGALSP